MIICNACHDEYDPDEGGMCSCEEARQMAYWRGLWMAEKAAGLLRPQDEIDDEMRDAGRGHLVR